MKLTYVLLFALAASLVLLAGCAITPPAASPLPSPATSPPITTPVPTPTGTTPTASPTPANAITLTAGEVAKHSTPDDCWMIIDGTVYDLSGFASQHSGGSTAIAAFCGQDSSQAFDTRGGTGSHTRRDRQLLATAALGALGATIAG